MNSSNLTIFLDNLFDPSIVDTSSSSASSEERGSPPRSSSSPSSNYPPPPGALPPYIHTQIKNITDSNKSEVGNHDTEKMPREQEVYFILVIVAVGVTVFSMVTFSVYRLIEAWLEKARVQRATEGAVAGHQTTSTSASANSNERRRRTNAGGSVEFLAGLFSSGHHNPNQGASSSTNSSSFPAFIASFPNGSSLPRPFSRRGNSSSSSDNPPPYDDPPPYHIAIEMAKELKMSSSSSSGMGSSSRSSTIPKAGIRRSDSSSKSLAASEKEAESNQSTRPGSPAISHVLNEVIEIVVT